MKVKELKKLLENAEDDYEIVIADYQDDYDIDDVAINHNIKVVSIYAD